MRGDGRPHMASAEPAGQPLKVVLLSTLFPSSVRPGHGQFVHARLEQLVQSGQVQARVVAPVPWFPFEHPRFGDRSLMARTPRCETWRGIQVQHPRYLLPPKVGQSVAPFVLAAGALPALRRLRAQGFDFDLIDAHYYYPDGVAAAMLGRWLRRPVVVTARGSDLFVLGQDPVARGMMKWAAASVSMSIGVCNALAAVLRGWGVPAQRVRVVRNGVDLARFQPVDREGARRHLGLQAGDPLVVAVGNLVPIKGLDLVIDAVAALRERLPGLRLVVVGRGPLQPALQAQARRLGVADRVHFAGFVPNDKLAPWYAAADVSVLASSSEGWANVILESMACGTPVLATDVGGSAEVIGDAQAGAVLARRDAATLAGAIEEVHRRPFDRLAVRRYAEQFSWEATTLAQLDIFRGAVSRAAGAAPANA